MFGYPTGYPNSPALSDQVSEGACEPRALVVLGDPLSSAHARRAVGFGWIPGRVTESVVITTRSGT